jgi:hypothetical protein
MDAKAKMVSGEFLKTGAGENLTDRQAKVKIAI